MDLRLRTTKNLFFAFCLNVLEPTAGQYLPPCAHLCNYNTKQIVDDTSTAQTKKDKKVWKNLLSHLFSFLIFKKKIMEDYSKCRKLLTD